MASRKARRSRIDERGALNRRQLLQRSAALGLTGSALGAGYRTTAAQTPESAEATPATTGIVIEETGANLPTEETTIRWLDLGPSDRATLLQAIFPAYEAAHPNITIQYEPAPGTQRNEIIPLSIQTGDAPDVFLRPGNITPGQMVSEGWVRPLDDIIPNFEEWKQRFPTGTLSEGVTVFDGKVYACPYASNKFHGTLLLYNTEYMEEAGYDPSEKPLTVDEFRDAARKITKNGAGNYYGFILGGSLPGRWSECTRNVASLAGAPTGVLGSEFGQINWQTGEFSYTSDEFRAAIELWLALRDDGSVFPGFLAMTGGESRGQFSTQRTAGMTLQGPWNISLWAQDVPDFEYGVGSPPVPEGGAKGTIGYGPGAQLPFWLYAETDVAEVAGDLFSNITSQANQQAWLELTRGAARPIHADVEPGNNVDPHAKQAQQIFDQQMALRPDPVVRNPDAASVYSELRPLTPGFGETVQGIYTGQLDDIDQAMQDLQDRSDAELERAIKAAQDNGADVSRDDFVFPNWDPMKDYTDEDYKAL